MSHASPARNPSLEKKSAARMAAAQCIYQCLMNESPLSPEQMVEQYKTREPEAPDPEDAEDGLGPAAPPDYSYLRQVLESWAARRGDIERRLDASLLEGWTRKRMSPLMVAILCAALAERLAHPSLKSAVWVDEYVTIAGSFFSGQEVGFVNRLLDVLSRAS